MLEEKNTLGKKLIDERKRSKLTLEEIEGKIEISYQAYRKIELNKNNPSLETFIKIAELYNVSTDYLLGFTDERKPLKTEEKISN